MANKNNNHHSEKEFTIAAYDELAQHAALTYVHDTEPGIRRKRCGRGFAYFDTDGNHIRCEQTLKRINDLAIPPAYTEVWICPLEEGHLQATGRDSKKRKQYRYHQKWEALRDQTKFEMINHFGDMLPMIRKRIEQDLQNRHHLSHNAVLAAMVRILDDSYVRVGNDSYAKENGTYGLTTLRKKHAHVEGSHAVFDFKGKNNSVWHIDISDAKVADIVRQCEEIPGYELFKYFDEHGEKQYVDSSDLNAYLKDITGAAFTAKNFRTWAACHELFARLIHAEPPANKRNRQTAFNKQVKQVAKLLGHTIQVCKTSYLPPQLYDAWEEKKLPKSIMETKEPYLTNEEYSFLQWWKTQA